MDKHMLLPFQRFYQLKEALDHHYVDVGIVAGDNQLFLQQKCSEDVFQIGFADGKIEKMAELKQHILS